MNLAGKHVVVVGLGKSGLAAARLLGESGATVVLNDKKTLEELGPQGLAALALVKSAGSITLSLGGHPSAIFSAVVRVRAVELMTVVRSALTMPAAT